MATNAAKRLAIALLAFLMIAGSHATAGAQSATGSIEGTVVDQAGAVLPGATISVVQSFVTILVLDLFLSIGLDRFHDFLWPPGGVW